MDRSEILSLAYMRKELADKLMGSGLNSLSKEELAELHRLDDLTGPYDIVKMLFEELSMMNQYKDALVHIANRPRDTGYNLALYAKELLKRPRAGTQK